MYVPHFFIHSSINKHFGWFHVLVIINNAAIIYLHFTFKYLSIFCKWSELWDFPGGSVVKPPCSNSGGTGSILVEVLRSHMPQEVAKETNKINK